MLSKKTWCKIMALACSAALVSPVLKVNAQVTNGVFENPLSAAQKQAWTGKVFKAKPLVVLMDYKDYKHTELNTKDWKSVVDNNYNQFPANAYTPEHYQQIFFGDSTYKGSDGKDYVTMKKHLLEESGGSFLFEGGVAGWYEAEHEAKYYGALDPNIYEHGTDQNNASKLVKEAFEKVSKDPNIDLNQYDVEDPLDLDGDGDFHEADGVIDTLIVLHPGIGEEYGGGSLGADAIWPFQAKFYEEGSVGYDMPETKDINGKKWKANKFILMEQNLPPDLMVHEYGHYLGLPDLYGSDEPSVQYWSQMGGSYTGPLCGVMPLSYGGACTDVLEGISKKENMELNWTKGTSFSLDDLKQKGRDIALNQESIKGDKLTSVKINLPSTDKTVITPTEGKKVYFSGQGDNLRNSMQLKNAVDLTKASSATFSFKTWYDIDPLYDFASVQVREKGTQKWTAVKGNITTTENPNDKTPEDPLDRNPGNGISGTSNGKWVDANFDLSTFLGKEIELRIYWWTDGNTPAQGVYLDELAVKVDNKTVVYDGAEDGTERAFRFNDFTTGDGVDRGNHKYVLEWRNYANSTIDNSLGGQLQSWIPGPVVYDPGLLMWYVNDEIKDQEVVKHPGYSSMGVVDADQNQIVWYKNNEKDKKTPDHPRYQLRDAAFSLREQAPLKLDWGNGASDGVISEDINLMMNPTFDDSKDYTNKGNEQSGLILPNHGIRVFVTEESANRSSGKIHITTKEVKEKTTQQTNEVKEIKVNNNKVYIYPTQKYADDAYVSYLSSDGKTENKIKLAYNSTSGAYEGDISFAKADANPWKINFIIFNDTAKNTKALYNIKVNGVFGADLSAGDSNAQQQPEVVVNVEDGKTYKEGLILNYSVSNTTTTDVKLNGNVYNGQALKEGQYVLNFTLTGSAGQIVKKEIKFTVESNTGIGWVEKDGKYYYYYPGSDTPATGWQQLNNKWYYLGDDGARYSGWLNESNGEKYYFDANGAQHLGWLQEGGNTYYLGEGGAMIKGWEQVGNKWYNFNPNGVMRKGWFKESNQSFYFDTDGAMHIGWLELSGKKYSFYESNGGMMTGWQKIDNKWYYFITSNGEMARNRTVDGYKIGEDGVAIGR